MMPLQLPCSVLSRSACLICTSDAQGPIFQSSHLLTAHKLSFDQCVVGSNIFKGKVIQSLMAMAHALKDCAAFQNAGKDCCSPLECCWVQDCLCYLQRQGGSRRVEPCIFVRLLAASMIVAPYLISLIKVQGQLPIT